MSTLVSFKPNHHRTRHLLERMARGCPRLVQETRWNLLQLVTTWQEGQFKSAHAKSSKAQGPVCTSKDWGPKREGWRRQPRAEGGGSGLSSRFIHSPCPCPHLSSVTGKQHGNKGKSSSRGLPICRARKSPVSRLMAKRNLPSCAGHGVGRNLDKQEGTVAPHRGITK